MADSAVLILTPEIIHFSSPIKTDLSIEWNGRPLLFSLKWKSVCGANEVHTQNSDWNFELWDSRTRLMFVKLWCVAIQMLCTVCSYSLFLSLLTPKRFTHKKNMKLTFPWSGYRNDKNDKTKNEIKSTKNHFWSVSCVRSVSVTLNAERRVIDLFIGTTKTYLEIECSARTTLHHDVSTSTEVISRLLCLWIQFFFFVVASCAVSTHRTLVFSTLLSLFLARSLTRFDYYVVMIRCVQTETLTNTCSHRRRRSCVECDECVCATVFTNSSKRCSALACVPMCEWDSVTLPSCESDRID